MRHWLGRREREGLTLRELSIETGVPTGTLGHWAWKLRREDRTASPTQRGPAFVELLATPGAPVHALEIVLAHDRRVLVHEGFDENLLARIVRTLEQC